VSHRPNMSAHRGQRLPASSYAVARSTPPELLPVTPVQVTDSESASGLSLLLSIIVFAYYQPDQLLQQYSGLQRGGKEKVADLRHGKTGYQTTHKAMSKSMTELSMSEIAENITHKLAYEICTCSTSVKLMGILMTLCTFI